MRRREFITLLGSAGVTWPVAARAQTPPKMLRVGVVSLVNPRTATFWVAFDRRMHELGYVEGQNLTIDFVNLSSLARPAALACRNATACDVCDKARRNDARL